jgi:hypothetical protein
MQSLVDFQLDRIKHFIEAEELQFPRLSFGDYLTGLRRATGMLKGAIASDFGWSYQKLTDLEHELFRTRPADGTVMALAMYYGADEAVLHKKLDEWETSKIEMAEIKRRLIAENGVDHERNG